MTHGFAVLLCFLGLTASRPGPVEFSHPEPVTIRGYGGDAMEPFITRDGKYLFFNNSNDPKVDTNLHWAERVSDVVFQATGAANPPAWCARALRQLTLDSGAVESNRMLP